jgi:aerobic carbon-monoxide dehydrogenase large subunit
MVCVISVMLGEHVRYGEDAQLLNVSLMDYAMPRADGVPTILTIHHSVPCTTNPLGVKGAGEPGVAGSLPSAMNAIIDALAVRGIGHLDLPASPQRIWQALQQEADAAKASHHSDFAVARHEPRYIPIWPFLPRREGLLLQSGRRG